MVNRFFEDILSPFKKLKNTSKRVAFGPIKGQKLRYQILSLAVTMAAFLF